MPSRRKLMMGSVLGLASVATLAIGFASWFWLPGQQAELEHKGAKLEAQVGQLAGHVRNWHNSADGNMDLSVRALPASDTLPAWAGELLAEISATGATNMSYNLGQDNYQESVNSRILETSFEADVHTLGKILDRVSLWRPGVTVNGVELEAGDHNRIQVNLSLKLLGSTDA